MAKTTSDGRGALAFIITFVAVFVLVGGVMVWLMLDRWNTTSSPQETTPASTTPPPAIKDDRRLLIITEDGGEAQGFTVLSFEPTIGRVRAVPVPRETVMTAGTQEVRLFEMYRCGDVAAVSDAIGVPVEIEERLIELDFGSYEGAPRSDPGFQYTRAQFPTRYPGGESAFMLAHRVYSALEDVKRK